MVNFILESFNSEYTAAEGTIVGISYEDLSVNAVAELNLDVAFFTSTFKFQSDATDINDASDEDLMFTITDYLIKSLDEGDLSGSSILGLSKVTTNPIATVDAANVNYVHTLANPSMGVDFDYVRYLAHNLFNTYLGADLFNNETELRNSISEISTDPTVSAEAALRETLKYIMGARAGPLENVSVKDSSGVELNISRELLLQVKELAPERLSDFDTSFSPYTAVPLRADDTINFKVTIKAAVGQEDLTGVDAIPDRTYRIKLNLVASGGDGDGVATV